MSFEDYQHQNHHYNHHHQYSPDDPHDHHQQQFKNELDFAKNFMMSYLSLQSNNNLTLLSSSSSSSTSSEPTIISSEVLLSSVTSITGEEMETGTSLKQIDRLVEMSLTFRTVMVVIYLLTAVVAFISNTLALLLLNYGRRKNRQLNLFLSNLGLSDIIFAIFNIPFTYITLIYNTWWLPEFLCPLTSFVQVLAPTVAFYTLIAIGIGRYYVIVTGQESLFLTKSSHTKLVIAMIWIMAGLVASPILIATKISPVIYENQTYVECTEEWSALDPTDSGHSIGTIYTIIVFVLTFILPVVALTYLYGHIGIIVYKHQLPMGDDNRVINQNLTQTKVKVLKMLILLVVSFIICWSPCQIFYLMLWIFEDIRQDTNTGEDNFNVSSDNINANGLDIGGNNSGGGGGGTTGGSSYYSIFYYSLYFIFHWLSCSHTIMNPFIYCFYSNNFQKTDLMQIICCKINHGHGHKTTRFTSNNHNNHNNNNDNHDNFKQKSMKSTKSIKSLSKNDNNNDNNNNSNNHDDHHDDINNRKQFRHNSLKIIKPPINESIIILKNSGSFQTYQV